MEGDTDGERKRERSTGRVKSEKQENQSEPSRCWKQKKYVAPARARESCLDQKQKRAGFRKGMCMVMEQNPGTGEGLKVGL